jgi:hypothetical protein
VGSERGQAAACSQRIRGITAPAGGIGSNEIADKRIASGCESDRLDNPGRRRLGVPMGRGGNHRGTGRMGGEIDLTIGEAMTYVATEPSSHVRPAERARWYPNQHQFWSTCLDSCGKVQVERSERSRRAMSPFNQVRRTLARSVRTHHRPRRPDTDELVTGPRIFGEGRPASQGKPCSHPQTIWQW